MKKIGITKRSDGPNYIWRIYAPVYGFRSDLDVLKLTEATVIYKYSQEIRAEIPELCVDLRRSLESFPPDYLMIFTFRSEDSLIVVTPTKDGDALGMRGDFGEFTGLVFEMFITLRLFKEGIFLNSGLWSYTTGMVELPGQDGQHHLGVTDEHMHSTTTIASLTQQANRLYYIDSAEVARLREFVILVDPLVRELRESTPFAYALDYFSSSYESKALRYQFTDLCICLEALLLKEQAELSYRLATRVASLIGKNAAEKRAIFKETRDLYDVRSKLVHGSVLRDKHISRLQNVPRLRDIVRRTLLASFALVEEVGSIDQFHDGLEELEMDEEMRKKVQLRAATFGELKM